jgi:hypothetical protein
MSHLDLDPIEESRKRHEQKLKLEIWFRHLSLKDKQRLEDFTARLALLIAELKEEKRR